MRIIFAIMLISIVSCSQKPGPEKININPVGLIITLDTVIKPLMTITPKDTIINDTLGTIKYLLNEVQRLSNIIRQYNEHIEKADKALESVNGIMFYLPERRQFFKL